MNYKLDVHMASPPPLMPVVHHKPQVVYYVDKPMTMSLTMLIVQIQSLLDHAQGKFLFINHLELLTLKSLKLPLSVR